MGLHLVGDFLRGGTRVLIQLTVGLGAKQRIGAGRYEPSVTQRGVDKWLLLVGQDTYGQR